MTGYKSTSEPAWCEEHNVPEAACIECRVGLVPKVTDYGWCKVHGVAQCPLEHPDIAQLNQPPQIEKANFERAERALAAMPRSENNSRCKLHENRIQFASIAAIDKAGVDIAVASEQPVMEAVSANGEIIYDETRSAHLASRLGGTIWRVDKQVNNTVRKSDVLALIDAAQVGQAKAEFLKGLAQLQLNTTTVERLKPLMASGGIPGRQFREAEAALKQAQIQLLSAQQTLVNLGLPVDTEKISNLSTEELADEMRLLGLPKEIVAELDHQPVTSNLLPVRSPLSGIVVNRHAVAGEVVQNTQTLFEVSDISHMWLMLDVRQEDARLVFDGQTVLFRPTSDAREAEIRGRVVWISTAIDERTRTVKVRADLPNPDGRIRANTFGAGRLVVREEPRAVVVPVEAVHTDGCCSVVFVRDKNYLQADSPKFFHIRKVRLGMKEHDAAEIIAGVLPGEVVASKGSIILEAQLLKSKLGEGCGCSK